MVHKASKALRMSYRLDESEAVVLAGRNAVGVEFPHK